MTKKYQSQHAEVIHKTAEDFLESGFFTKKDMKKFDDMCLVNEEQQKQNQQTKTRKTVRQTQLKKAS